MVVLTAEQLRKIETILDKRTDGTVILLDWNAFDPSAVVSEPELKDIFNRFLDKDGNFLGEAGLEYDDVRGPLLEAAEEKKRQLMKYAKEKALEKMLDECRRLKLQTLGEISITDKHYLALFHKEACRPNHKDLLDQVTNLCFKRSPCWKEDTALVMKEKFGLSYDPKTVRKHANKKGNGFLEKFLTRGACNTRQDLRDAACRGNAEVESRIKRNKHEAYPDGKTYQRKKNPPHDQVMMSTPRRSPRRTNKAHASPPTEDDSPTPIKVHVSKMGTSERVSSVLLNYFTEQYLTIFFMQTDKNGVTWVRQEDYVRLQEQVLLLKSTLQQERKKYDGARLELLKLRSEQEDPDDESDGGVAVLAVVKKHGGKAKAPKKTSSDKPKKKTAKAKAKKDTIQKKKKTHANQKKGKRKRVADFLDDDDDDDEEPMVQDNKAQKKRKKNTEPAFDKDDSEVETLGEDSMPGAETGDNDVQKPEAAIGDDDDEIEDDDNIGNDNDEIGNEDNNLHLQMGAQIVDVPVPENLLPAAGATNSQTNQIEELQCPKDHTALYEFMREPTASYCEPSQKFGDAVCMSCNKGFCNNSKDPDRIMPNAGQPLYYCSNYESICSVVLCHSCFTTMLAKSGKVSRRRRH